MMAGKLASFALAATLSIAPLAMAQAANTTATNGDNMNTPAAENAGANWHNNPLLTENGSIRAGKLIGTNVYNSQNQKLGSVDGVVINRNGQAQVVLSADNKLIEVPFNRFQFGDAQNNGNHKVMLPDMTTNELGNMQAFHYTPNNNG